LLLSGGSPPLGARGGSAFRACDRCLEALAEDSLSDKLYCERDGWRDSWVVMVGGTIMGFGFRDRPGVLFAGFEEKGLDVADVFLEARQRARQHAEQDRRRRLVQQRREERTPPTWRRRGERKVLRGGSPWRALRGAYRRKAAA
jgi:hypothetical protein